MLASSPSVASWSAGRLDVFARGTDNALWHMWYDGQWHNFENLGGNLLSAPAATSWASGRIDIVAVQSDGRLYDKVFDGSWHPFALIGTNQAVAGDPGLSTQGSGKLDLTIASGSGDTSLHFGYNGGWAASWDNIAGGILSSGPRNVSWSAGRIDVFARGTDNFVWHAWWTGVWNGWERCGLPGSANSHC